MSTHFADRLLSAIEAKKAAACVGLDPLLDRLPGQILDEFGLNLGAGQLDPAHAAAGLKAYGSAVIDCIAPFVPAVKINIAFFERYRADGVRAYFELVELARHVGLVVIGDVKRADIGHTSTQYAMAQMSDREIRGDVPDAITINPYFGVDGIKPFVDVARAEGRGLFVLVQTSNSSATEVQGLTLSDGSTVGSQMARLVASWGAGEGLVGEGGYSLVGAVVSPRDLDSTVEIRRLMPQCIFLVPGFGAQGRTVDEVRRCFQDDGRGALVTASRSVIYAYQQEEYAGMDDWRGSVTQACEAFAASIGRII